MGACVGCMKLNSPDTAKVKRSKVRVTGQMNIVHKNIKPQTSSGSGNIPVL